MPCKSSPTNPSICCVHPEHAYVMNSNTFTTTKPSNGFLTTLERFDMDKKDEMASEFSEINLHLAVHDDTEKKLPPITSSRTVKLSLREMLQDGKFKSPSRAILTRTVKQFTEERHAKETAKKRAILDRLKLKTKTKIKLNKISRYMAELASKEKEAKLRERRAEMGLPPDLKIKKAVNKIRAVKGFEMTRSMSNDALKFPKITERSLVKTQNSLGSVEDVETCSSYGGFLSNEVGRSDSMPSLPAIQSTDVMEIPSRPAYFRKEKKVKVPTHLERFRFMRIKN